jgi:hypothetical protein
MQHTALDERPVPAAPVLVLEGGEHTVLVEASRQAGGVEAEQRGQGVPVRMRRRLGVQQQFGKTQRVLAQERAYRILRVAAVVALVEQQVERSQDGVPPGVDVRQVVHVGQPAQLT